MDCRRELSDEGFSAYSGNRGPDLERAKQRAVEEAEAHGECVLAVQHSDRLARGAGDAPGAADHLGELIFWSRRHDVRLASVQDPQTFENVLLGVMMGERNSEDSRRKATATRAGLKRRKERGDPVGPVPLGYSARAVVEDGAVLKTERVEDRDYGPVVRRAFQLLAEGYTVGEVCRALNADGLRTRPRAGRAGQPFSSRRMRDLLRNRAYLGERGYPRIIEDELFERVQTLLNARSREVVRLGGPEPRHGYLLNGMVSCGRCGAPLYLRSDRAVRRAYSCRNVRTGTGMCDAPPVRAEVLESAVLLRLGTFVGELESWLRERMGARQEQRQRLRLLPDASRSGSGRRIVGSSGRRLGLTPPSTRTTRPARPPWRRSSLACVTSVTRPSRNCVRRTRWRRSGPTSRIWRPPRRGWRMCSGRW